MASPLDGPNPLRPYYSPPSIGLPKGPTLASNGSPAAASRNLTSFGTSARDLLSDFDYSEYLGDSSPSVADSIRQYLETALWKYSHVLMSQPFEVAKTILQVYVAQDAEQEPQTIGGGRKQDGPYRDDPSLYSSDDEDSYFTPAAPAVTSPSTPRTRRLHQKITDRSGYIAQPSNPSYMLKIKDPSALFDVLGQLWTTNGPTSVWKGSNASFVYSLLLPTLDTFFKGLLSAIIGYPEDNLLTPDILTSTSPVIALALSCASATLASVVLAPIDTAKTLLMLSPLGHGPTSLFGAIRQLPGSGYVIPSHLLPITILSSTLPTLIANSTPLFLKSYLSLDPVLNPSSWSIFTLLASGLELGVSIPLETVLRRAQISTFTSPVLRQQHVAQTNLSTPTQSAPEDHTAPLKTVVPTPQSYRGIAGTMWGIIYEEGVDDPAADAFETILANSPEGPKHTNGKVSRRRRGQGIRGLYRSWRLEMWGVVGIWGSGFLGALLSDDDGSSRHAGLGSKSAGVF